MLELTLSSGNPAGKADVQVPISKFYVKVVVTHAAAQFAATAAAALTQALGYIPNGLIEVNRQSRNGSKPLIQPMSIRDLAEIAANNEGYIHCYQNPAFTQSTIEFSIELSNFGALNSDGQDFVQLLAKDFTAASTTTQIFSIGAPVITDTVLRYKAVACQASSQKAFNVGDAYALFVPDNTTLVDLVYPTGSTFTLRQDELENHAVDLNDIVFNVEGRGYPFRKWRMIGCELADVARVTLAADGVVYLLINETE